MKKSNRFLMILNHPSTKNITVFAAFFVLLMVAILLAERGDNSKITSFFDAFWYTIVTVTTIGYGDITPATTAGRVIAVIIMLGGVVSFGAVSGKIASVLVERQQKRNRGFAQLKKKRDHLVLCGWKPEGEPFALVNLDADQNIFLGEIALIDHDLRSATVLAVSDCETLTLSRKDYLALCEEDPVAGFRITFQLALRLSATMRKSSRDMITMYQALIDEIS